MRVFISLLVALLFAGCGGGSKQSNLDGSLLVEQKCASCHNLDMPPKTSEDEKAPPLFTVVVHLKDWMHVDNPSELKDKFINFATDYVINPSREKSYCDKESLRVYGVMPSQKGKVTKDEVRAIASYIFDKYDQKYLLDIMREKARIASLSPAEQVLETQDCKACHINGKVAPTFAQIGKKYADNIDAIKNSITHGSKGKWNGYLLPMKAYKLSNKQLDGISKWIIKEGENAK